MSRLHVPTSNSNYCNHSPIYSKLLDDSMSSYDDPQPTAHCNAPASHPTPAPPPTPAGARGSAAAHYEPSDHIPRLHEAHPYWVLEQHGHQHPHQLAAAGSAAARLNDERCCGPRPAAAACWRPLPTHGIHTRHLLNVL